MRALVVLLAVCLLPVGACDPPVPTIFAAPTAGPGGAQDLAFGDDDLTIVHVGRDDVDVRDALVDAEGRLLVLGRAQLGDAWTGFVIRFDPDGAVDGTFGEDGIVTTGGWQPSRLALADDGSVTVAGELARELALQHLDPTGAVIGEPVTVATPAPDGMVIVHVQVTDVVVDPGGTVTVAGGIDVNDEDDVGGCCAIEPETIPFTARISRSGASDPGYGGDGFDLGERSRDAQLVTALPGSPVRERHGFTEDLHRPVLSVAAGDRALTVGTLTVEVADDEFDHYLTVATSPIP